MTDQYHQLLSNLAVQQWNCAYSRHGHVACSHHEGHDVRGACSHHGAHDVHGAHEGHGARRACSCRDVRACRDGISLAFYLSSFWKYAPHHCHRCRRMIRCPSPRKSYSMNFRFLTNTPQILAVCGRCSNLAYARARQQKTRGEQHSTMERYSLFDFFLPMNSLSTTSAAHVMRLFSFRCRRRTISSGLTAHIVPATEPSVVA